MAQWYHISYILVIIGSGNCLKLTQHQNITQTNSDISSIGFFLRKILELQYQNLNIFNQEKSFQYGISKIL